MKDDPWRPKPGELVQIWDHTNTVLASKITGHGKVGYVIKKSGVSSSNKPFADDIWKVICFGDDDSLCHDVWHGWLRPVNKSSDIREVKDV